MPYINGHTMTLADEQLTTVVNPATGKPAGKVFFAGPKEMTAAIDAAAAAAEAWGNEPARAT